MYSVLSSLKVIFIKPAFFNDGHFTCVDDMVVQLLESRLLGDNFVFRCKLVYWFPCLSIALFVYLLKLFCV